jgi:hypothetical protein
MEANIFWWGVGRRAEEVQSNKKLNKLLESFNQIEPKLV